MLGSASWTLTYRPATSRSWCDPLLWGFAQPVSIFMHEQHYGCSHTHACMINTMDVHTCMLLHGSGDVALPRHALLGGSGPRVSHTCFLVQMHQEKADDANEKLAAVSDLHNKAENLKIKQQTLAKQNGEAYARFLVR